MTVKVHSGLCMKYSRWDISLYNIHCSYSVMQSCWKSEPEDRPQFSELVSTISDTLQSIAGYIELSMPLQEDKSYFLATES